MSGVRTWLAEPHEAETVARLLIAFRDHLALGVPTPGGRDGFSQGGLAAPAGGRRAPEGAPWPSDNAILAAVERLIEDPQTEYLLAAPDEDSPPAGVIQLRYRFSVWTAAPDCWLEDLFVSADARRSGCGEALVSLALERAALRGCRRIELDTNEGNEPALALYRRMGFSEHSKTSDARDIFLGRRIEPAAG
jgi:GNAT superfamily N-acetyltransferase